METKELQTLGSKKQNIKIYPPAAPYLAPTNLSTLSPIQSMSLDPKSSAKARGKRLRTARMMTGLTRKSLEEKYSISASTIQAWEAAKAGGLTERGVARILAVLEQEGISCTADWLLYEIGAGPQHQKNQPILDPLSIKYPPSQDKLITQELLVFRSLHFGAADLVVLDDGMEPKFRQGDYVAGIYRTGAAIESALGLDCIVQTTSGNTLFRRIKKSAKKGLYNLVCVNADTTVIDTTLYDQALISVAPVIWHRHRRGHSALDSL